MAQPPNGNALRAQGPNPANVLPPHLYNPYQQAPYYPMPFDGRHLQQYVPRLGLPEQYLPPPAFPGNPLPYPPLPALQGHTHPNLHLGQPQIPHRVVPQVTQGYVPIVAPAQQGRQRPNDEPRPGGRCPAVEVLFITNTHIVFSFQVDVIDGDAKREFTAETDILWDDFRRRILLYLENVNGSVELAYKITGDTGKASHLKNEDDFRSAMGRLCQKANNARSRAVCLEIRNIVSALYQTIRIHRINLQPNRPRLLLQTSRKREVVKMTSLQHQAKNLIPNSGHTTN
jgi:hypothetical protein